MLNMDRRVLHVHTSTYIYIAGAMDWDTIASVRHMPNIINIPLRHRLVATDITAGKAFRVLPCRIVTDLLLSLTRWAIVLEDVHLIWVIYMFIFAFLIISIPFPLTLP